MESTIRISRAERAGGALGRLWKKWLRLDERVCKGLATYGVPAGLTNVTLWAIKLIVLAVLFYFAFWLGLIVAIAAAFAWGAKNIDPDDDPYKQEWRDGHSGIGLYDKNDLRIDMGEPYDP